MSFLRLRFMAFMALGVGAAAATLAFFMAFMAFMAFAIVEFGVAKSACKMSSAKMINR